MPSFAHERGAKAKVKGVTLLSLNYDQNRPNNNTYTLTTTKIFQYRSKYIQTATHRLSKIIGEVLMERCSCRLSRRHYTRVSALPQ